LDFPYIIIQGSWGYTGGLTIQSHTIDDLIDSCLDQVMTRILEKGGLCSFIPGISDEFTDRLSAKLAEIQPTKGSLQ
jgi:hypothetical protein